MISAENFILGVLIENFKNQAPILLDIPLSTIPSARVPNGFKTMAQ